MKKLFELEVPEVYSGIVESRPSLAKQDNVLKLLYLHQEGVDAVGSCIGQRGTRIQTVISELSGEKIDIIQWDDDAIKFIPQALSPAK